MPEIARLAGLISNMCNPVFAIRPFFLPQKYYTNNQVYGNVATNLGVYFCRIFIAHSKVKREG